MPWTPDDAERHTHKATTWELKEFWARIANGCLERTGDEGRAIREANAGGQAAGGSGLLTGSSHRRSSSRINRAWLPARSDRVG